MAPAILRSRLLWAGVSIWVAGLALWAALWLFEPDDAAAAGATFGAFLLAGKLAAVPTGLSFGLSPFLVALIVLIPDLGAILFFYRLTEGGIEALGRVSDFVRRQQEKAKAAATKPNGFLRRYGSWGLFALALAPVGFYSPLVVSAIGQAMELSARRVLVPVIVAATFMTGLLVVSISFGITALAAVDKRLPFAVSIAIVLGYVLQDQIRRRLKKRRQSKKKD